MMRHSRREIFNLNNGAFWEGNLWYTQMSQLRKENLSYRQMRHSKRDLFSFGNEALKFFLDNEAFWEGKFLM